jgi:hypothetical protein
VYLEFARMLAPLLLDEHLAHSIAEIALVLVPIV